MAVGRFWPGAHDTTSSQSPLEKGNLQVFDWNLKLQLEATQNWHKVIRIGKFWTQNHGKLYLNLQVIDVFYIFLPSFPSTNHCEISWNGYGINEGCASLCHRILPRGRQIQRLGRSPRILLNSHSQVQSTHLITPHKKNRRKVASLKHTSTHPKTPKKGCITEKSSNKNTSSTNISASSSWPLDPQGQEKGTCQTTSSSTNGTCQGAHRFILTFRNEFPKWIPTEITANESPNHMNRMNGLLYNSFAILPVSLTFVGWQVGLLLQKTGVFS